MTEQTAVHPTVDESMGPAPDGPAATTVVVPTFNEAANVPELLRRIDAVAAGSGIHEVIFVDDSTDDTPAVIDGHADRVDVPVRLLHRAAGERVGGLSGAVVAGIDAASHPWVVVMDADLQHPPEDLPRVLAARAGHDLVVASRYVSGGTAAGLDGSRRRLVSRAATLAASAVFPRRLRACSDTMTGFFAVRRSAIATADLRPQGFKILLEILGRHHLRVAEVPFAFARRHAGESKAELGQGMHFLAQLARLRWDAWRDGVVRRVGTFAAVGLVCLVLDLLVFNVLLPFGKPLTAKLAAGVVSVLASYWLNARFTWPGRRGRGRAHQLLAFLAVSGVGIGLAELCLLVSHYGLGWTSPAQDNLSANGVGLALGMVWRYLAYERWVFGRPDGERPSHAAEQPAGALGAIVVDLAAVRRRRWQPVTGGGAVVDVTAHRPAAAAVRPGG